MTRINLCKVYASGEICIWDGGRPGMSRALCNSGSVMFESLSLITCWPTMGFRLDISAMELQYKSKINGFDTRLNQGSKYFVDLMSTCQVDAGKIQQVAAVYMQQHIVLTPSGLKRGATLLTLRVISKANTVVKKKSKYFNICNVNIHKRFSVCKTYDSTFLAY